MDSLYTTNNVSSVNATKVEKKKIALTLDQNGFIQDFIDASEILFGFNRSELLQNHISTLLPQLLGINLFSDGRLNSRLAYLTRCGHPYVAKAKNGKLFDIGLNIVQLEFKKNPILKVIIRTDEVAGT